MCGLQYLGSSSNIVNKNGYLMLPYTETVFASQTLSSRTTNINPFLMLAWNGILDVNPKSDDWVEVRDNPTIFAATTQTVNVYNYISCPPIIGGLYGTIIGRSPEAAGIEYWVGQGEAVTKANFNQAADETFAAYGVNSYVNEDGSKSLTATPHQILFDHPLSADQLANEKYLYTETRQIPGTATATFTATDFNGVVTTTTIPYTGK
jgi:hypothetical protein